MKTQLPEYTDGCFRLFEKVEDPNNDYPVIKLKDTGMSICFNEVSVFDHNKYQFAQGGIEVTKKLTIPRYDKITSSCVCVIDGVQNDVYNATGTRNKYGFPETEITLKKVDQEYEVVK